MKLAETASYLESLLPDVNGEGDVHVWLRAAIISYTVLLPRNSWRKFGSMPFSNFKSELFRNSPFSVMNLAEVPFHQRAVHTVITWYDRSLTFINNVKLINCIYLPLHILASFESDL